MSKSNVMNLISVRYDQDENAIHIPKETKKEVFCEVKSVSGNEWASAGSQGLKAEYKVTVFAYDYQGEEIAELDGVRYGIYRTYLANNEDIELYLERKSGTR